MNQRTLCFPVRGNPAREVLLGLKKAGFGAGKYAGFGGKVEAGETITTAALRELWEEAGLEAQEAALRPVAHLTFLFPARPTWSQEVHVFLVTAWEGTPRESPEMRPAWFPVDRLPLAQMWQDGAYWLPRILAGEWVRATFTFGEDHETVVHVSLETTPPSAPSIAASSRRDPGLRTKDRGPRTR